MQQVSKFITNSDFNSSQRTKNGNQISLPKIVTAGLSGLAGGVVVGTVIVGSTIVAGVVGSIVGAVITGSAEYHREKKASSKNKANY